MSAKSGRRNTKRRKKNGGRPRGAPPGTNRRRSATTTVVIATRRFDLGNQVRTGLSESDQRGLFQQLGRALSTADERFAKPAPPRSSRPERLAELDGLAFGIAQNVLKCAGWSARPAWVVAIALAELGPALSLVRRVVLAGHISLTTPPISAQETLVSSLSPKRVAASISRFFAPAQPDDSAWFDLCRFARSLSLTVPLVERLLRDRPGATFHALAEHLAIERLRVIGHAALVRFVHKHDK